ncbi:MAG: hypothetical protein PHE27_02215 [Alphaproteobacteria bacterium]|nr:hypothetical protein [Alphaproteobacteria bacterium]
MFHRAKRKLAAICLRENWMLGVIDEPIENAPAWTSCPPIKWLSPRSSSRYFADPFSWPGRSDVLLCEEYSYKTRTGFLKRLEIRDDAIAHERYEKISLPGHLSYPFLFEQEGAVYVMPESCVAGELAIFRWEEEPGEWIKIASPLVGVCAADGVFFEYGGYFWIAYTHVSDASATDNLNLLYATSLEGPWVPHPQNPVVQGTERSRCGGTPFEANGAFYRPAQDCTKRYGAALRIMRIDECSPEAYRETEVAHIAPSDRDNPHGLHTLSAWGNRCLVDGKRMEFSIMTVLRKARRRLVRLLGWGRS